jgi:hypothetical protein
MIVRKAALVILGVLGALGVLGVLGALPGGAVTDAAAVALPAGPVLVSGMDLHDGTIVQDGTTLHMLGTRYGCGFDWGVTSHWCGFGSAAASQPGGPWGTPTLLFSPAAVIKAPNWTVDNGKTWSAMCGLRGAGCFNPRMVRTPAGRWLLWFNAPGDKARHANPYWVMSCAGPAGPCGSPRKPAIFGCNGGGDFSIAIQGTTAWMICSGTNRIITIEKLAPGDVTGVNVWHSMISNGPAEGVGIGILHISTGYEAVWSQPNCGYCSGPPLLQAAAPGATEVQAGYATASAVAGPWTYRGLLSPDFCTGQPRTVFGAQGASWEWVDHWNGTGRETNADVAMIPLEVTPWSCQ